MPKEVKSEAPRTLEQDLKTATSVVNDAEDAVVDATPDEAKSPKKTGVNKGEPLDQTDELIESPDTEGPATEGMFNILAPCQFRPFNFCSYFKI